MINKLIDEIEISDLENLIENEVGEGKTLEYKSELKILQGDDKKEFLADISSFANSEGGDIIFGVREDSETHLPCEICGISVPNEDEMILQIENLVRDSIQPRILDIKYRLQKTDDGILVLIIRIPASAFAPHRVNYNKHGHFYTRNSKGKYPMDVSELRSAFNHSQELADRIEQYKINRLQNAAANKYGWLASNYPIFAFLAVPSSVFLRNRFYSVGEISNAMAKTNMSAFGIAQTQQITIDGIRLVNSYTDRPERSAYGHCFISGIVELYASSRSFFNPAYQSMKLIYKDAVIKGIEKTVRNVLAYYKELSAPPPISISCAIINGQGFTIRENNEPDTCGEIDRDLLLVPDVVIDNLALQESKIIKPILDSIWNACGFRQCQEYTDSAE